MNEAATLQQLLTLQSWTSSAFPIGAFSCSHGMETAIQHGTVHDATSCHDWIHAIITQGSGWNDSIIMFQAYRLSLPEARRNNASPDTLPDEMLHCEALRELNALALALQAGAERYRETTQLAAAFLASAAAWQKTPLFLESDDRQAPAPPLALPVVCGCLGAWHDMPARLLVACTLQSVASNLAWIATRLIPLGQTSCLQLIASLEPVIEEVSDRAHQASLDELGSCTLLADIASLQHEQLTGRVCLT